MCGSLSSHSPRHPNPSHIQHTQPHRHHNHHTQPQAHKAHCSGRQPTVGYQTQKGSDNLTRSTGKTAKPAKPDIFTEPPGTSQWFSQNFTGAYSEAGIQRWIGSLRISEPKKQEGRTNIQALLKQYPSLSDQQTEQLQKNAEAWGLPPQHIRKLQANHLISILSVITHFTE